MNADSAQTHSFDSCADSKWQRAIRTKLAPELLAAALAIVCYLNMLPNDYCDDGVPVVQRSALVNEPGQWLAIWTTDYWYARKSDWPDRDLLYRPLAITTYRLARVLAGPSPLPQHAVNIVLHAFVSALIVRFSRHLGLSPGSAWFAGAEFAVLPIHSEVLGNVVGRADLIAAGGVLGALLCNRLAICSASRSASRASSVLSSVMLFAAMSAKESAMAAVAIILLFDFYWNRLAQEGRNHGKVNGRAMNTRATRPAAVSNHFFESVRGWMNLSTIRRICLLAMVTGFYLFLRYHALEGALHQKPGLTKTVNFLVDAPPWQRALGCIQLWGMYWAKSFWPAELCIHYSIKEMRLATGIADRHVLLGIIVTVVLVVVSIMAWRRGLRAMAMIGLSMVLAYVPTSNVLVLIRVSFAERIWYLPSVFLCILLGFACARMPRRPVVSLIVGIVLFGMAARCWIRATEWRNNGTLYYAAVRDHPNDVGCLNLYGQWLSHTERYAEACEYYRRAIQLDLGFTDAPRNLGHAALRAGFLEEALEHLHNANMHVPGHKPTVEALEWIRAELGSRQANVLVQLAQATEANPHDVLAEIALVRRLRELADDDRALARFKSNESKFASSFDWQHEYAILLVYLNRRDPAIERYERALSVDRRQPNALVELAMLLLERRENDDLDRAWKLAEEAAALVPGAPFVLVCQAELLLARSTSPGDLSRVLNLYRQALRSLPEHSPERPILEQRIQALGG